MALDKGLVIKHEMPSALEAKRLAESSSDQMPEEFIEQTMLDIYDQIVLAASNGSKFVNARVDLLMINQTQKEYVLNRIEKKLTDEGYDIQLSYTDENGNLRLGIDFDDPDGIDWDYIAHIALLVLFLATFAMSLYTFLKIQGY